MSDNEEKGPHHAAIKAAIEAGDPTEVARLHLSKPYTEWARAKTLKECREQYKKFGKHAVFLTLVRIEAASLRTERLLDVAKAELTALKRRIAELERQVPQYCGTWSESKTPFKLNELVTDKSALWICRRATHTRPPGDDWTLMVKSHGKN
jgi:hypothetical protein